MEILCENRAFANRMIEAYECFRRAKVNKRDAEADLVAYWRDGTQHFNANDIVRAAHYGDLSKAFSFMRRPDNRTFREYLKERYAETLDTENDEGLTD